MVFAEKIGFGKAGFGRSKRLLRILCEKMRVIQLSFIQIGRKGVELWPCKDLCKQSKSFNLLDM